MKIVSINKTNIVNLSNCTALPDTFVDVHTLTLRQLCSKLEPAEDSTAYEASWFMKHPELIFCTIPDGDATLTVYKNRFYTYTKFGYTCVIRIDFKNIEYERDELFTNTEDIPEKEFLDKPFLATLAYIGEMQWEANSEKRETYHKAFSIDGDEKEWNPSLATPCFLEMMEELECLAKRNTRLYTAVKNLSVLQQTIVVLLFFRSNTQKQIADRLQVSPQAISQALERAKKSLKKQLEDLYK